MSARAYEPGLEILRPRGKFPGVGTEKSRKVQNGIARYVDPYGSSRYVWYSKGEPVAGLQVVSERYEENRAVIANVYTLPGYRRKGYATKLLARARKDFRVVEHAPERNRTEAGSAWARAVRDRPGPRSAVHSDMAKIRDDREVKRKPGRGYVIAHDTFLSGWGGAGEGKSYYVMGVDTEPEAYVVMENFKARPEFKRVRFSSTLPRFGRTDHVTIADRTIAPRYFEQGAFGKPRGRPRRDPARTLRRGPRRGAGARVVHWEEREEDGETWIQVYARGPGACEWAKHHGSILGSSWECTERGGDFAYASFPAYDGWQKEAKQEGYRNLRYLEYSPPRSWIASRDRQPPRRPRARKPAARRRDAGPVPGTRVCPVGTEIQTIVLDDRYFNQRQAESWIRRNGFDLAKVDRTGESYRFRQRAPSAFKEGTFRTFSLRPGVKAVIGCPL